MAGIIREISLEKAILYNEVIVLELVFLMEDQRVNSELVPFLINPTNLIGIEFVLLTSEV